MATFLENLRNTFLDTDFYSRGKQTGRVADSHKKNEIVDFFQYAPDSEEEFDYIQKNLDKHNTYYTPFSWSDGDNNLKGYVVSGNTTEGPRVLGVELEDGRSLSSTGAKKFFDTFKNKGAFSFAQEGNLWENKKAGDWPLQPGNPFEFNENRRNATFNNEGKGSFNIMPDNRLKQQERNESIDRLRDAMLFFKNLRKSKGQE